MYTLLLFVYLMLIYLIFTVSRDTHSCMHVYLLRILLSLTMSSCITFSINCYCLSLAFNFISNCFRKLHPILPSLKLKQIIIRYLKHHKYSISKLLLIISKFTCLFIVDFVLQSTLRIYCWGTSN